VGESGHKKIVIKRLDHFLWSCELFSFKFAWKIANWLINGWKFFWWINDDLLDAIFDGIFLGTRGWGSDFNFFAKGR
jgi:hypothetical protein